MQGDAKSEEKQITRNDRPIYKHSLFKQLSATDKNALGNLSFLFICDKTKSYSCGLGIEAGNRPSFLLVYTIKG